MSPRAKGRPEALAKKHDDDIMAAAIAYAVMQEQGKYVASTQGEEGHSHMKQIFGETENVPTQMSMRHEEERVREL